MWTKPGLWIALAAMLCSFFFSTCYSALRAFAKSRLSELLEEQGQGDRLDPFLEKTPQLLRMAGAMRTICNLIVALAVFSIFDFIELSWLRYLTAFVVASMVVSIFGVGFPVSLAHHQPERFLARSMRVLEGLLIVLNPLASALLLLDPMVRHLTGAKQESTTADERLTEEILSVVDDHTPTAPVNEEQKEMLEGVIEMRSTTAGQIMTPRTEVEGIELSTPLDEVKQSILNYGHSRYPVYLESLDNIVGILYVKDLIRYLGTGQTWSLRDVAREAFMVPESKPVGELLADFKTRKVHIAMVLDEYGGTAGLVTIEDIMEEIVGDIQGEYEQQEDVPQIRRLDEHTVEVDARIHVDDVNDELNLHLPEDDAYDTIGGLVFSTLGRVPEVGETFTVDNVKLIVLEVERTKVGRVRLEMAESEAGQPHNL